MTYSSTSCRDQSLKAFCLVWWVGVRAGAVLLSEDDKGIDHLMSYFTRKFNKQQFRYSTLEKESLALSWPLDQVSSWSRSSPIRMYNHNQPSYALVLHNDYVLDINHKNNSWEHCGRWPQWLNQNSRFTSWLVGVLHASSGGTALCTLYWLSHLNLIGLSHRLALHFGDQSSAKDLY